MTLPPVTVLSLAAQGEKVVNEVKDELFFRDGFWTAMLLKDREFVPSSFLCRSNKGKRT